MQSKQKNESDKRHSENNLGKIMKKCYEQDSDGKCVEGGEQNELKSLNIRTLDRHFCQNTVGLTSLEGA